MKITNGKIKLDERDKRFGNFVIQVEPEYVKVCDIAMTFTYRVRRNIPIGIFLETIYNDMGPDSKNRGIHNYVSILWAVLAVVPDNEFLETVYAAAVDCMRRNPELYGVPAKEVTDEEDKTIIEQEKGLHDAVKEFEGIPDKK